MLQIIILHIIYRGGRGEGIVWDTFLKQSGLVLNVIVGISYKLILVSRWLRDHTFMTSAKKWSYLDSHPLSLSLWTP